MEKKWILISVLMHAAILLGVGLVYRPALKSAPASLMVSLVSFLPGDSTGGDELTWTPRATMVEAPLNVETRQKLEPSFEQVMTADPKPPASPAEDHQPDVTETPEPFPEKNETPMLPDSTEETGWEQEPGTGISSRQDAIGIVQTDNGGGSDLPDSAIYTGDLVSQLQTANFKHQTPLLAFSGHPSSLVGILSGVEGSGPVRPEIISLPEPAYPVISRRLGEEGRVILEVRIGARGQVLSAEVIESSSHERLDQAALCAVKRAVFQPLKKYGMPGSWERTVAYRFRLEEQ